jgi:NADH-quinone oxidoreductase subunit G
MADLVKLIIDDAEYEVPQGMNLVDAAKRYAGIDIPVFCYHPKLGHDGNCRMCLVELSIPRPNRDTGVMEPAWFPTLQTACTQYVSDGMEIRTVTDVVTNGRREILEFLLSSHPLDCPICDKGGECPLQNLTMRHGPGTSRMYWDEKMHLGKHVPLGEIIYLDQERCIQCARCIRFQDKIAGEHVLDFDDRGRHARIITNSDPGFDSIFSGNTTDICPVGALTTADFRFNARPWEMTPVATVCSHCSVGCNMTFDTRTDREAEGRTTIKRAMPRQNEAVNEVWICDKGRFTHHHMDHAERVTTPKMRKGGKLVDATWEEALTAVAGHLKGAAHEIAALAGGRLSNEDYFAIQKLVRSRGSHNLSAYPHAVPGGELVAQVGVGAGTDLQQLGAGDVILVASADLHESGPIWYLRVKAAAERGATLITLTGRGTDLDKYSDASIRVTYGEEASTLDALAASGASTQMVKKSAAKKAAQEADPMQIAADALSQAENVVIFVGSEGLDETGAHDLAQAAANVLISTDHIGRANNGLILVWPSANGQGSSDMGFRHEYAPGYMPVEHPGKDYAGILAALGNGGGVKVLLVAGADPVFHDPAAEAALRTTKSTVIVMDMFMTETAKLADVVFPTQSTGEREGTFTSGERRVQRFYPAVEPVGESLPDWLIAGRIGEKLGMDAPVVSPALVLREIAEVVPQYAGINYQRLAEVEKQYPDVGGDDLYYGGTAVQNQHGLGVQWPTSAELDSERPAVGKVGKPTKHKLDGGFLAIPVEALVDAEPLFEFGAPALSERIPAPYVRLNPADAEKLSLEQGDSAAITMNGRTLEANTHLDARVPVGVAALPRELQLQGAPLHATPAQVVRLEKLGA